MTNIFSGAGSSASARICTTRANAALRSALLVTFRNSICHPRDAEAASASRVADVVVGLFGLMNTAKRVASRPQLMQEPEALGRKLHVHGDDTGDVAARPTEACDQTGLDRVTAEAEDDGNRSGRGFGCERRGDATHRCDDSHWAAYK